MKREMLAAAIALLFAGGAIAAEPADSKTLSTQSTQMDSLATSQGNEGRPTNAKTKIAMTITQSKNAVPQRGWIKLNFCTFSGVSSAPDS